MRRYEFKAMSNIQIHYDKTISDIHLMLEVVASLPPRVIIMYASMVPKATDRRWTILPSTVPSMPVWRLVADRW